MTLEIAMDFDGTLFEDGFPGVGNPKLDVIKQVKKFQECGAEVALWTCREGEKLDDAIEACDNMNLHFVSINENTPSRVQMMKDGDDVYATRKMHADIYVDDKAGGSIEHFLNIDVEKTCSSFEGR